MAEFEKKILKENPEKAQEEIQDTLTLLTDEKQDVSKTEYPIRYMFYSIWERFREVRIPHKP